MKNVDSTVLSIAIGKSTKKGYQMNHLTKYSGIMAVALVIFGLGVTPSHAQSDVRMQVSAQETYVGMPVTLYIQLENVSAEDVPEFPSIDGMDVRSEGIPSRNTSITIINGRRTESNSVTFSYQFTPRREGTFEIPSITIETANGPRRTQAFRISATKSETGDLMFAEVAGLEDQLYVGQPIDLTLRVWLKPYQDKQHQVTISAADMWRMIGRQSQWGPFAETLEKMAAEGKTLRGREVLRPRTTRFSEATTSTKLMATFYPKRAGQIEMEDVQIVAQYPTKLGQSRDPFASFFRDSPFGGRSPFGGNSPFGSMFEDDFFAGRGSPFGRSLDRYRHASDRCDAGGRANRGNPDPNGRPTRRLSRSCRPVRDDHAGDAHPSQSRRPNHFEDWYSRHRADGIGASPAIGGDPLAGCRLQSLG